MSKKWGAASAPHFQSLEAKNHCILVHILLEYASAIYNPFQLTWNISAKQILNASDYSS